jgi:DNA-binding response OmpR family regulator
MARILVIDDRTDVRATICVVLRVHHFDVVEAGSAAVGLKLFAEQAFDAAIVDIFLDHANGFDVIAAMRAKVPDLPVVAISGIVPFDTVSHLGERSRVVCLRKPFRPSDLLRAIETARHLSRPADDAGLAAG